MLVVRLNPDHLHRLFSDGDGLGAGGGAAGGVPGGGGGGLWRPESIFERPDSCLEGALRAITWPHWSQ